MRDKEFRAWLKNEKKMVEVEEINFEHQFIQYKQYEDEEIGYDDKYVDFDDIELLEYADLKDKNGKKIFEGDIVKLITSGFLYKVIYDEDDCCFKAFMDDLNSLFLPKFKGKWFEVIGNIYDNPELLKVKDEKK